MKREALIHTKMKRLCRRLDIPTYQAVGILESIWHLAARETPRGDIGKLCDEDIAVAIDYPGDERKLIEALTLSGWLDADPECRVCIHDWHEHADDAVHRRLARGQMFFWNGHAPSCARLHGKEREAIELFYTTNAVSTKSGAIRPKVPFGRPDSDSGRPEQENVRPACAQNSDVGAPPRPAPPIPVEERSTTGKKEERESEREIFLLRPETPSPKNGSGPAHGSRFSLDVIPPDWSGWANKEFGWTVLHIGKTFDVFRDYWRAKAGAAGRKADWFATWRNWCRRENETPPQNGNGLYPRPVAREDPTDRVIRVANERVARTGRL